MKRLLVVIMSMAFCLLAIVVWAQSEKGGSDASAYTGPQITMRFSTHAPATHTLYKKVFVDWWSKELMRRTNNKMAFKFYWSGALHGPTQAFNSARTAITDFTTGFPSYEPSGLDMVFGMELPFAAHSSLVSIIVSEHLYPKYFKKEYEAKGVYLGVAAVNAPFQIATTKPVNKLEDLKGMKIRTAGGPSVKTLEAFGAVPVFLPTSEFYIALQRGVIDGVFTDYSNILNYRVHEVCKYIAEGNFGTVSCWFCISPKFFDSLPRELKLLLYNSLRELAFRCGYINDQDINEIAKSNMIKGGVKVIKLTSKELDRWKAAASPVWDEFIKKNEAKGRPAKQMLKEMKELTEKYASMPVEQIRDEVIKNPVQGIIGF